MTYLERAIKDNYADIVGAGNKQRITYVTSDNHSERYNDPEEKVRAEFWAELIYDYDYPATRIKVEVTIPDRVPTDRADIVIFEDDDCKKPYAVVECKKDGVTDAEFLQAIEQGVGNATWVKLRAKYVVIIAGATRRVLDFSDDNTGILERESNIIADLPKSYGKPQAFRFYKGGIYTDEDGQERSAQDIKAVEREDLIAAIKKCHNTLWGGGRLSPPMAFGELCKLIFVKISDEQNPRKNGEPYQFQIKTHEPSSKLAERINSLYNEQKEKDPEVFTESIKVDDRVLRTVVSHLESINLNKTELDVKGVAFEQFMDGFFKGDFGQYFTPRPIIEFAVKMMKPKHDWNVLDPACGSGGFLLHALDYIRHQAGEYFEKDAQSIEHYSYWHDFAAKHLYGIEINDEIARVAKMNMIVHDDGHTNVISFDALDSIDKMHDHNHGFAKDKFDLILTNPPFGSTINKAEKPYLVRYELGNTCDAKGKMKPRKNQNSEVLFIERVWEFLKPNTGKAAIILPDGILTNNSSQYIRDFILERFQLLAVISLPQYTFAHFGANAKASLIVLQKKATGRSQEYDVFCAVPDHIGYDAAGKKDESDLDFIANEFLRFCQAPNIYQGKTTDQLPCCIYTIPVSSIANKEIFCNSIYPKYIKIMATYRESKWCRGVLSDFLDINPATDCKSLQDETLVTFIPMSAVGEKDNTVTPELRPYLEVKKGYTSFKRGDLLWAKITPCMQNGKSCLTDDIGTDIGFGSTEFHVIRKKADSKIYMPYIWALLSNDDVLTVAQAVFNGSAGQQRVSESFLKNFPAIIPDYDMQVYLASKLFEKQKVIIAARKKAEQEWQTAKTQFERELLGD